MILRQLHQRRVYASNAVLGTNLASDAITVWTNTTATPLCGL